MERFAAAATAAVLILSPAGLEAQTLRGSNETMQRQNLVAREHDYTFLQTSSQIRRFVNHGYLVPLNGNANYELAGVSHPYARPQVRLFVERLSAQYHAACGEKLVVTSLTRPALEQPRNASELSVHPTGMAVDLRVSRKRSCVRWLEDTLLELERRHVLDTTRERRPPHYHVALFPKPYERYVISIAGPEAVRGRTTKLAAATAQASEPEPVPVQPAAASAFAAADAPGDVADAAATIAEAVESSGDDAEGSDPEATEELQEYRVNRGDSLWSIARRYGTTVDTLKDLNSLTSSRILAGQVITVPVVNRANLQ